MNFVSVWMCVLCAHLCVKEAASGSWQVAAVEPVKEGLRGEDS